MELVTWLSVLVGMGLFCGSGVFFLLLLFLSFWVGDVHLGRGNVVGWANAGSYSMEFQLLDVGVCHEYE